MAVVSGKAVITISLKSVLSVFLEAAAAAHHLIREGCGLLSVHDDLSAVELALTVVVKRILRIYFDISAIDVEVAVAVDAVGISLPHGDLEVSAVDLDRRCIRIGFLSGIDAVIARIDREVTIIDHDISALEALCAVDRVGAALELEHAVGMDRIVFTVDGISACSKEDGVIRIDAVFLCGDRVSASGQDQIVLAHDAVTGR